MVYGITNIIVYSHFFQWLRVLMAKLSDFTGKLFTCMMCMGFWVGVVISWLIMLYYGAVFTWVMIIPLVCLGGFFSGTTWLIHTIQEWFEYREPTQHNENEKEPE